VGVKEPSYLQVPPEAPGAARKSSRMLASGHLLVTTGRTYWLVRLVIELGRLPSRGAKQPKKDCAH